MREIALEVVTLEEINSFDVEFFVAGLILEASIYSLLTKNMPESMQMPFQINVLKWHCLLKSSKLHTFCSLFSLKMKQGLMNSPFQGVPSSVTLEHKSSSTSFQKNLENH